MFGYGFVGAAAVGVILSLRDRMSAWAVWGLCLLVAGGSLYGMERGVRGARERIRASRVLMLADVVRTEAWAPEQVAQAWNEVLTSRRSFAPDRPDVAAEVERRRRFLEAAGKLDPGKWKPEELEAALRDDVNRNTWRISYLTYSDFTFSGLPPSGGGANEFTIRYRFDARRGEEGGGDWVQAVWLFVNERAQVIIPHETHSKSGAAREFSMDARMIDADGRLLLRIVNESGPTERAPAATLFLSLGGGLEVLVPVGGFGGNLGRGFLLLWLRLAFLAAAGLAASAFLSGPMAAFFLIAVMAIGWGNTFMLETAARALEDPAMARPDQAPGAGAKGPMWGATRLTLSLLPNFDQTDPVADLVAGRRIGWDRLLWRAFWDVVARGGILLGAGAVLFHRREVGLPTTV